MELHRNIFVLLHIFCWFAAVFLCCSCTPLLYKSCLLQNAQTNGHCCNFSDFFGLGLYGESEQSDDLCNLCQKKLIVQEGEINRLFCALCRPSDVFCYQPILTHGHTEYSSSSTIKNRTMQYDVAFNEPSCANDTDVHCTYENYTATRHLCICEKPQTLVDNFTIGSFWNRESDGWSIGVESQSDRQISETELTDCGYQITLEIVQLDHVQREMQQLGNMTNCPNYCIAHLPDTTPWKPDTRLVLRVEAKTLEILTKTEVTSFAIREIFIPSEPPAVEKVTSSSVHLVVISPKVAKTCTDIEQNTVTAKYTILSDNGAFTNGTITAISVDKSRFCTTHGLTINNLYSDTAYTMSLTYTVAMSRKSSPVFTIPFHTQACIDSDEHCQEAPLNVLSSTKPGTGSVLNIPHIVLSALLVLSVPICVVGVFVYRCGEGIKKLFRPKAEPAEMNELQPLQERPLPKIDSEPPVNDVDSEGYQMVEGAYRSHVGRLPPPPSCSPPPTPDQNSSNEPTVCIPPKPYAGCMYPPKYSRIKKTKTTDAVLDQGTTAPAGYTPVVNSAHDSYREYSENEFIPSGSHQQSSTRNS